MSKKHVIIYCTFLTYLSFFAFMHNLEFSGQFNQCSHAKLE